MVVLVPQIDVQDADFRVQRAEQQHRVPIAQEATEGARLPGEGREEHQRHEQHVRGKQQVPTRVVVA